MNNASLKSAMIEVERRLNSNGFAGFIRHQDCPSIISSVEKAIESGYLRQGGQIDGGILIREITESGQSYLDSIR